MTTVATMPGLATPSTTGGIKRKRVIDTDSTYGSSQLHTPSSPTTKRPKVEFDMTRNTTHLVEDWNEKGVQLVREEVRLALRRHHAGESAGYDAIKELFVAKPSASDAPSSSLLRKYLLALSANAGMLDKRCSGLVKALLDSQWYGRDDQFVKAHLYFLSALLNANNGYTRYTFDSLVMRFADMPASIRRVCITEPMTRKQIFDRIHQAISQLLTDFPSSSTTLADSLAANFPHPRDSRLAHNDFANNLIRVSRYAPSLRNAALSLLTERLVKLDSGIATGLDRLSTEDNELRSLIAADHEEELAKGTGREGDQNFDDVDSDVSESDSDSDSDLDEDLDDTQRAQKEFRDGAARLDDLLNILFAYYEPIITSKGGRFSQEVFDHMVEQFVTNMLPDRSRSVQFLLFRYAQSTPEMATQFIETCQRIFEEQTYPQRVRGNAGTFLASFVARGKNITEDQVRTVVYRLGKIMDHRRVQHELTARGPDLNRYFTYYLATQAILYIVCFRWRDLLVFDEDEEETIDEQIEQIALKERDAVWPHELKQQLFSSIHSVLNPLRVCAADVVDVFDEVSNYLGLIYCHTIIERNRRNPITRAMAAMSEYSARETALGANSAVKVRLPSEYPFDPYELPRSKHWVEDVYRGWQEPPGMSKPEEPEDSSDAEDDEVEDAEEYDDDTEGEA